MSLLWRLLWGRAGHEELPDELGPDPEPDEPEAPEPVFELTAADFARAADILAVNVATVRAVAEIEAAGRGFLPSGRASLLFESHIFGRLTQHRHAAARDSRGRALSSRSWDRTLYGPAGEWQWDGRLLPAARLDSGAAHRAASYGLFQVLGTNHAAVGAALDPPRWQRIEEFVTAMNSGAAAHLDSFVGFVRANRLDGALRRRDWQAFARSYNGPAFRQNRYDERLAAAYERWSRSS